MDGFNASLQKLSTLLAAGHLTPAEFEQRRQALVDSFVGTPGASAGGVGPMRRSHGPGAYGYGGFGAGPYGGGYGMGGGYGGFGGFGGKGGKGGGFAFGPSAAVKVQPVSAAATVEEMKAVFSAFGTIAFAVIKEGSMRHGYVNFATPAQAAAAVAAGTVVLGGQPAAVSLSYRPKPAVAEGAPTNGIGIFNIPFIVTQEELQAMLSAFPGFQNLKMVTNKLGQFRGYAFAYFDSVDNAAYAKSSLLGQPLGDQVLDVKFSNKPPEVAFAPRPAMPY